jgi:formyl-CoA transferase
VQGDRRGEWIEDEAYATPAARLLHLKPIFARIEQVDHDQGQVRGHGDPQQVRHSLRPDPLDEEIADEAAAARTGTIVEVDHPTRGKYLTVGNPIKMSDSPTEVTRSPCWASTPTRSGPAGLQRRAIETSCAPSG